MHAANLEGVPSGAPFLSDEKGGKESAEGGIWISLPLHPLLKTTNQRGLRTPLLDDPPEVKSRGRATRRALPGSTRPIHCQGRRPSRRRNRVAALTGAPISSSQGFQMNVVLFLWSPRPFLFGLSKRNGLGPARERKPLRPSKGDIPA